MVEGSQKTSCWGCPGPVKKVKDGKFFSGWVGMPKSNWSSYSLWETKIQWCWFVCVSPWDDDDACLMIQKTRWGTSLPDLAFNNMQRNIWWSKSWVLHVIFITPTWGLVSRSPHLKSTARKEMFTQLLERKPRDPWNENIPFFLHGWRTVYLLIHEWLIFIGFHVGNIYQATHGWYGYWLNQRWYCYTSVHPPENLTAGAGSPENGGENQKEEEISNLGFPSFSGSSR